MKNLMKRTILGLVLLLIVGMGMVAPGTRAIPGRALPMATTLGSAL